METPPVNVNISGCEKYPEYATQGTDAEKRASLINILKFRRDCTQ